MEVQENIKSLCKKQGISLSKLEQILGYGNSSLSKAKTISSDRVFEIAKYFGVSMEYIMTGKEEKPKSANAEISILLEKISLINKEGLQKLIGYADDLISSGRYEKIQKKDTGRLAI